MTFGFEDRMSKNMEMVFLFVDMEKTEKMISSSELTDRIIEKAKYLGASLAGVASIDSLKKSPSHKIYPKMSMCFGLWMQSQQL
jgi:hypothetical protein